jgi:hypothetical protein
MKKLLLLASVAFFGALNLNAQCTPDGQYTQAGIYPDSATNFAPACLGQAYSQVITNVVPVDTCAQILPAPFPCTTLAMDSIVLDNVTGLPPGLTFACNGNNCTYLGGTTGCAIITGTPTALGTYNMVFNVSAYVGGVPTAQTFTVDYYEIVVSSCSVGIEENTNSMFKLWLASNLVCTVYLTEFELAKSFRWHHLVMRTWMFIKVIKFQCHNLLQIF